MTAKSEVTTSRNAMSDRLHGRIADQLDQLRRLEIASLIEGLTLIALLLIAVPLKHMAGYPLATSVMGPLHGMAFLFYVWTVLAAASAAGWTGREIARLLIAALAPFGFLAVLIWLARRKAALSVQEKARA